MTSPVLLAAVVLQQASLVGVVRDSVSLQPVAFAEVTVSQAESGDAGGSTSRSDRFGAFAVRGGAAGPYSVVVKAFGYAVWAQVLESLPAGTLSVLLSPAPERLEGLVVGGGRRTGDPLSLSRDAFVIDAHVIERMPPILESDVLRVAALSPSASPPSDYLSVPFIRGGTAEGTPVLLDGVRLFNAFHMGGFVSAINPEAVDHARVLPGSGGDAFAVGSLSGAIDIATRDGARDRVRTSGALGLASARLSVEGPVGRSTSFLVSGRRTWIDRLTQALERAGRIEEHLPYFFRDLHGKVTSDLGGVRRISVSGYRSAESFSTPRIETRDTLLDDRWDMSGDNSALSVHFRDRLGDGGVLDARVARGHFWSSIYVTSLPPADLRSEATEAGAPRLDTLVTGGGSMKSEGADVKVTWGEDRSTIAAGVQATRVHGDLELVPDERWEADIVARASVGRAIWRIAVHAAAESPLAGGLDTRAGVRVDRFSGLGATTLGGFAELAYAASSWGVRISAARSHQALASTRDEEALLASFLAYDFMVPVERNPVPRNSELTLGWDAVLGSLRLRVDSYWRRLENIRMPPLGNRVLDRSVLGDPELWEFAEGSARGVEAAWSWVRESGLSILGSYRWAEVTRRQEGVEYTPRFHRSHELETGASYRRGASSVSAQLALRSGQPETSWVASVSVPSYGEGGVPLLPTVRLGGRYNSDRLPRYARVDASWRRDCTVGGGVLTPYVSVANLFNTPNAIAWLPDFDEGETVEVSFRQLPVLPFVGVEFRF